MAPAPACSWSPAAFLLVFPTPGHTRARCNATQPLIVAAKWLHPQCATPPPLPFPVHQLLRSHPSKHTAFPCAPAPLRRRPTPNHSGPASFRLFPPIQPKGPPNGSTGHPESLRCDLLPSLLPAQRSACSLSPPSFPTTCISTFVFPFSCFTIRDDPCRGSEGKGIRRIRPGSPVPSARHFLYAPGTLWHRNRTRRYEPALVLSPQDPTPRSATHWASGCGLFTLAG